MQEWGELHVERDVGYVGLATVDGGLTNAAMAVPATFARAVSADRAALLPRLAARAAAARGAGVAARGSRRPCA